jgi:hypothetical protein
MTRDPRRALSPIAVIGLAFVLAGCFGGTDPTQNTTPEPTPEPVASDAASVAPEPTAVASETPPSATASPSFSDGGGFTVIPNPEADALFLERDECTNLQDGYQLQFPDDWWTNTEIARFPACVWFSPTFYEVVDETQRPDEIAIEIFWVGGDYGWVTEEFTREDVAVGTQRGVRAEIAGTPDDSANGTTYVYVVQLGPTAEEGPNLVARTDTDMGGDYALNKAVLDRIMATIEFIGTTQ